MAYEQKPDTGSIFEEADKPDKSETDRDYSGSALLQCPHCRKTWSSWISGWLNHSKDGVRYQKLTFKPKEAKPQPTTSKMQPRSMKDELDDGDAIPF